MTIDIETLGFTAEEIQQRVIDKIAEELLCQWRCDGDGEANYSGPSELRNKLDAEIKKQINDEVTRLGEDNIHPAIRKKIESLILCETNHWGEKKGKEFTFVEYIIHRAEEFMKDDVDHNGKARGKSDSYSWKKAGTRIEYAIDKHLQYAIERAMEQILEGANKTLVDGIAKACKMKLEELGKQLKVNVKF